MFLTVAETVGSTGPPPTPVLRGQRGPTPSSSGRDGRSPTKGATGTSVPPDPPDPSPAKSDSAEESHRPGPRRLGAGPKPPRKRPSRPGYTHSKPNHIWADNSTSAFSIFGQTAVDEVRSFRTTSPALVGAAKLISVTAAAELNVSERPRRRNPSPEGRTRLRGRH